jgi:beta-1,4-mannosyl-glycoprotein beta-1,4-N-acetylglucosaminyltransferase
MSHQLNKKKIIDCFLFYNEFDLLTYRLNILNDLVDYFVIVESMHTYSGHEKSLNFNINRELYEKFEDKIIYVVVDDMPFRHPNIDYQSGHQWKNESCQRNAISRGLNELELNECDLIIISDLDEIVDANTLAKIKNGEIVVECNSLDMDVYYYNLNTKILGPWAMSKILTYKNYKEINMFCNDIRGCYYFPKIQRGGWHLCNFGDSKFIKNKIEKAAHQEYNNDKFTNLETIEYKINNHVNLYSDLELFKVSIKDNNYLPVEYEKYLANFIKF